MIRQFSNRNQRSHNTVVDKIEAVAAGRETIYDLSADAGFFGARDENDVDRMNKAFRSDRQLAQEIAAGLEIVQRSQ